MTASSYSKSYSMHSAQGKNGGALPMTALRTLIIDDEPLARRGLQLRLNDYDVLEIIGQCNSGSQAVTEICRVRPDLIFLDIQMPGMDGFNVLRSLPSDRVPMVIFVTAYDEYAIKAFETNAVDYLLKPIDEERLETAVKRAVEKARRRRAEDEREKLVKLVSDLTGKDSDDVSSALEEGESLAEDRFLTIRDSGKLVRLKVDEIGWIDAAGDYMCVHAHGETHVVRATMKEFEKRLTDKRFQRVHRSAIVNMDKVREVRRCGNGEHLLELDCGHEVRMSRSHRHKLQMLSN